MYTASYEVRCGLAPHRTDTGAVLQSLVARGDSRTTAAGAGWAQLGVIRAVELPFLPCPPPASALGNGRAGETRGQTRAGPSRARSPRQRGDTFSLLSFFFFYSG